MKNIDTGKLLISTKVGTHINPKVKLYRDRTRPAVLKSVEASRRRLEL